MKASIIWWDLNKSSQTIDSLRFYLKKEGVEVWKNVKGMLIKFWVSNPKENLWGAVMIWQDEQYMHQVLPPNRALELIGYPPAHRFVFDIEAIIEGDHLLKSFNQLGLIYEGYI